MKGGEFVLEASTGSCSVTASVITFVFLFVTAMESFQVAKNDWVRTNFSLSSHDPSWDMTSANEFAHSTRPWLSQLWVGPQSKEDTVWPPKELQPDWRHEGNIRGTQSRKQLMLVWVEVRGLEWSSLRRGHLIWIWKVNRTFREEGGGEENDPHQEMVTC